MNNPMQTLQSMNPMQLQQRFQQFQSGIQGNPQQQVMQIVQNGNITQQQWNQAQQIARMLAQTFGIKL